MCVIIKLNKYYMGMLRIAHILKLGKIVISLWIQSGMSSATFELKSEITAVFKGDKGISRTDLWGRR